LGECLWFFAPNEITTGTSFFGNATSNYITTGDQNALSYSIPIFTFSGSGGSDILTFADSGVYLLQFSISVGYPYTYITPVDIIDRSSLVGVSAQGSTYNLGSFTSYALSIAVVTSILGGSISFPNSVDLLSDYGLAWSTSYCSNLTIARLS